MKGKLIPQIPINNVTLLRVIDVRSERVRTRSNTFHGFPLAKNRELNLKFGSHEPVLSRTEP
jgi:hypothetical protein